MAEINSEKVIKGLELCKQDAKLCFSETECPYQCQFPRCCLKLMADALELLKEQEAVKPINMENDIVYGLSEISLYLSNIGEDDFAQTIEDACKKLELLKQREEQIKNRDESLEKAREEIKWLRKMLKEQEPKPVGKEWNECPNCGKVLSSIEHIHFCGMCGQAVKWE